MSDNLKPNLIDSPGTYIPVGIRFFRGIYCFFVSFGLLVLLAKSLGYEIAKKVSVAQILLGLIIDLAILMGFYRRKPWLVPLILIDASWNLIWRFFHVVGGDALDANMLAQKFGHLIFAFLFSYQIYFFTKRETKAYFRWNGQILI